MTHTWTFSNPTRVTFRMGAIDTVGDSVVYKRVILITTPGFVRRGISGRIHKSLGTRLVAVYDRVTSNPRIDDIDIAAAVLRPFAPDCLIALGGGSSMDTAKTLAKILNGPDTGTLAAHFRNGVPLAEKRALPVITIPTTSGTGSEVTPFATIWDFREKKKYSLTGTDLFPEMAILDPSLTLAMPEPLAISSGLDAISHALESIWNKNASPVSIGIATQSLHLALGALPEIKRNPTDLDARMAMMEASLLSGLAISQTRTALAHSISYPLTLAFDLPHGIACSFCLPELLRFNAASDDGRLQELAERLGYCDAEKMAVALNDLLQEMKLPSCFSEFVKSIDQVLALADKMLTPGRADNNLREASVEDVRCIVRDALEF